MASDRSTSRSALLYDTAASLRLVDTELFALGADDAGAGVLGGPPPDVASAGRTGRPPTLERATAELRAALAALRDGRLALRPTGDASCAGLPALEVTPALTPVAAILDALDRTQSLVDDLEAAQGDADLARAQGACDGMRAELFGAVGALQDHATAARQFAAAAGVLAALEGRLLHVVRLLDPVALGGGAGERQVLPEEIVLAR